jgi:hypothetical protein
MPVRLSHSAREMLNQCSEKYRLHYIERLRSPLMYSSLFFGNALDAGFSRILLEKKKEKTEAELELLKKTEEAIFVECMEQFNHNGQLQSLPKNPLCDYYNGDYDEEFASKIAQDVPEVGDVTKFMLDCRSVIKAKEKLTEGDKELYNYISWLSLCHKGKMMLKAYRDRVLPQIHEVFAIQKQVEIVNAHGDKITGAIDFIASFSDNPSRKYICDNKSSSKAYKANAVLESDQLATYCEAEGMNYAAYVVVEKTIYKKHPKIHTQIIKSEIKEAQLQETFDKFEQAVYTVEEQRFDKNFDACFSYGKLCPYFALCKHGKAGNLIKV